MASGSASPRRSISLKDRPNVTFSFCESGHGIVVAAFLLRTMRKIYVDLVRAPKPVIARRALYGKG
jgi:hypothetical protein